MREPVSTSAVAIMVSEPPLQCYARAEETFGRCRALGHTTVSNLAEAGNHGIVGTCQGVMESADHKSSCVQQRLAFSSTISATCTWRVAVVESGG